MTDGTAYARQHGALAELAHVVRQLEDLDTVFTLAAGLVASALEVDYSEILECFGEGAEFRLRAGTGWRGHRVGRTRIRPQHGEVGYSLALAGPVVVRDYRKEVRFFVSPLLLEHGVVSGIRVPIGGRRGVSWGLLGAHTREEREFAPHEAAFMRAAADMVGAAITAAELREALQRGQEEMRESAERLRRAEKLEVLGRFVCGAAHDFNNVLTVIAGNTHFLLDELPADDARRDAAAQIADAVDRAGSLTRHLLASARQGTLEAKVIDLNAVITRAQPTLQRLIGEHIEVSTRLGADAGAIRMDPGRMEQVILNLAANARDAMPRGGTLRIETHSGTLARSSSAGDVTSGATMPAAVLVVTDTGCGMTDDVRAHAFDPFYTTKQGGEGTGLGLANVREIIEEAGGQVEIASESGQGTAITITVPSAERLPAADQPIAPQPPGGQETVLLVEDDVAVRHVILRALTNAGYTALTAGDGVAALETARTHAGRIDLVILDVLTPRMTGPELSRHIQATRPGLRVLYISGNPPGSPGPGAALTQEDAFLNKPFSPSELLESVRSVLRRGGPAG